MAAARVFHRRSRDPGAAPDRRDPAPRVRAHAREPACIFRAAPRERILFSGSRLVRVVPAARLPDLRERTLDHEPRIARSRHRRFVLRSQRALDADLRAVAPAAGRRAGAVALGGEAVCDRGRNNRRHERRFLGLGYSADTQASRRACRRPDARDVDFARVGARGNVWRAGHGARHGARRSAVPEAAYGATRCSMRACRSAALLVLLLVAWPPPSEAQAAAQGLLQRADAAYSSGNRELAKTLYRAVLASDPSNSRAAFQLARLSPPGSAEAVALLRRYVKVEPGDPWGNMALGDALAKAGKIDEAIEQYGLARRKAPAESDVYLGLGRILRDAGRNDELVKNYEQWASRQPQNAEAWSELGRARQRAKRYAEAADAYATSLALKESDRTRELLDDALAETAISLRPFLGRSDDSDQNRITLRGLEGEWQFTQRSRLGLHAERNEVKDPVSSGTADAVALIAKWRPFNTLKLDGFAGGARLSPDQPGQKAVNRPWAGLRVRWTSPEEGPAAELRLRQAPLIATPGLVAQPVELAEIKAGVDLPVTGPFRVRARGQAGTLDSATDVNHRSGYQLGPVYRWRPAAEVGVFYSELGYEHATAAGYFAPKRAQTVELGTYIEYEGLSPLTFALDAGAGQQRVEKQGGDIRDWIATYRLWALVSWALKPGMSLELELEHYDSPVAGNAVAPTANWSYNAATLSLRFGVRPQSARSFLSERADRRLR
ncbi:MAG: tetratricopeptide repeat protein [Betaproteobacteria bacterium]|nr:MAG: tetratricopeptide repeat protein [Betaproteobacteria bacterium]